MDGRLFTFAGLINPNHDFIIGFYTVLVAVIILILAKMATSNLKIIPQGLQNIFEWFIEGTINVASDIVSREIAVKYLPLTATIALFVFFSNAIGIIPGFESPTSSWSFTLVLALVVFFYYHFEGIKTKGIVKYFAHFAGPVPLLAPLMLPVEIISHFSRIISLSFRLFGNIKGDDMFLLVMLMLAPWLAPLPAFAILTLMAFLQAFVFMILTYVYIAGAISEEEH
ncbi:F0F1 ATP synthase subunit A [Helicobacter kayseriensis]|uniref:F0F1 ATP synthase subunit A n=1 Tax=Helicobacter kayseriensis TaxID=2905877 RepID=UPI001E3C2F22|nr:F0F1 ATP synthase subunit A [Helicobacter kayseriensis]MCE3047356.1 F0F1 ATP synthase subunit A [Helicobacter kayseriensis]MCE3048727.1 F0F1 ATP synthase subunit A [Helicobacter kayseriensis]